MPLKQMFWRRQELPPQNRIIATRSACYRGWNPQNCQKRLGEGAKNVLVYVDLKPVALVQKRVALVQDRLALVQETLGKTSFQLPKHLLHPLLTTLFWQLRGFGPLKQAPVK